MIEFKSDMSQSYLKKILDYNSNTGDFRWLIKTARPVIVGRLAGTTMKLGYRTIVIHKVPYLSHRLAWLYVYGEWPKYEIDHINHERADNRIVNLRKVIHIENHRNISLRPVNTSGFNGVCWDKKNNKWIVHIKVNGALLHLGRYANKINAIEAREVANKKYGFHPNHGLANAC